MKRQSSSAPAFWDGRRQGQIVNPGEERAEVVDLMAAPLDRHDVCSVRLSRDGESHP